MKPAGAWCRVVEVTPRPRGMRWLLRLACGALTSLDPIRPEPDLRESLLGSTVPCPRCGATKGAA